MTREEIDAAQAEVMNEILDNIEANDEADPTPLQSVTNLDSTEGRVIASIDISQIPDGATATEFIETWQNTGNLTVSGTNDTNLTPGVTYRTDFQVRTTPTQGVVMDNVIIAPVEEEQPVVVELEEPPARRRRGATINRPVSAPEVRSLQPRPEGYAYGPMTPDAALQGRKEENKRYRKKKEEEEMLARAKKIKQHSRKQLHQNEGYIMGSNDLMIMSDHRNRFYFQKTDTLITGKLRDLHNATISPCPKTGHRPDIITNGLMYDKNMNPLTISYSHNKNVKSNKTFNRIDVSNSNLGKKYFTQGYNKWLVVNKTAFVSSGGKDFKIKHRVGYTVQETLAIKKKLVKQITEGKEFVEYLKSLIGQIYDEENYEIIYEYNFMLGLTYNNFYIYFQFPNLTITNSIEMSHQIENLMTRWRGQHYLGDTRNAFRISGGMEGLRTTFSAKDAFHGYSHSHLSTGSFGMWDQFCMGEQHFMSNINSFSGTTNELEFETMLIGMLDHVQWESLEGGPYTKMESIGQDSGGLIVPRRLRTLNIYGSDTLAELMQIIRENVDFNRLYDAFILRPISNKETVYTFDEKKFIQLFNKELGEEAILNFHEEWEIDPIVYIPSENIFRRSDFDIRLASSWKSLLRDARKKVSGVPITYMNGKYIRPLIVQEPEPNQKISKKVIQSLHPDVIVYVANIIHYHLLNELKNVKV
ncbi:MAG: hypothetical protein ACTSQF_10120 [Candidatus Heimdallarchaeaceae archaeon]